MGLSRLGRPMDSSTGDRLDYPNCCGKDQPTVYGPSQYKKRECELNTCKHAWLHFLSALAIQVPAALKVFGMDGCCQDGLWPGTGSSNKQLLPYVAFRPSLLSQQQK